MLLPAIIMASLLSAVSGTETGSVDYILPDGIERLAAGLVGRHVEQEPLPGGWVLSYIKVEPHFIGYTFQKDGRSFELLLEHPGSLHASRTGNFGLRLGKGSDALSQKEAQTLLEYLTALVGENDKGTSPWADSATKGISPMPRAGVDGRAAGQRDLFSRLFSRSSSRPAEEKEGRLIRITSNRDAGAKNTPQAGVRGDLAGPATFDTRPAKYPILLKEYETRLPVRPVLFYQIVLLAALLLVASRYKSISEHFRRVPREDWIWLGAWATLGLALRLYGGIRIPAHVNGHGYPHMYAILYAPPDKVDFWGVGNYSLHGLLQTVIPYDESVVVGVHVFFSVLTIPAAYALARFWTGSRFGARTTAAVTAVLPAFVFFAASDERYVPGLFFLTATLIVTGLAIRDGRFQTWAAAALLGVFTAQFQPFMRMVPLSMFAFVVSDPRGRSALKGWMPWAAAGVLAALMLDSVLTDIVKVQTGQGPAGNPFKSLGMLTRLFFPPGYPEGPPGNAFLDKTVTPLLFPLLALTGAAAGLANRRTFIATFSIAVTALVYTFPGIMLLHVASARLQLQAQPFYLLLVGSGMSFLAGYVRRLRVPPWVVEFAVPAALIAGAAAVWPGPIGTAFTPQLERRAIIEGLSAVEDGCRIVWPAMKLKSTVPMPVYLTLERDRQIDWRQIWNTDPPPPVDRTACTIYYRPAACFDYDLPSPEDRLDDPSGLRRECAELEKKMRLTPLFLKVLPALPDATQKYSRDKIETGFFRLKLE